MIINITSIKEVLPDHMNTLNQVKCTMAPNAEHTPPGTTLALPTSVTNVNWATASKMLRFLSVIDFATFVSFSLLSLKNRQ